MRSVFKAIMIVAVAIAMAAPAFPHDGPVLKDAKLRRALGLEGTDLIVKSGFDLMFGDLGSGLRDNSGTMQVSHGGGAWQDIGTASATISDAVVGAGWDGQTTTGTSQNAVHDWIVQIDTNYDGDVDNIDATLWATKQDALTGGTDYLRPTTDVDDTPVDAETAQPISSNWAYDHINDADTHTNYMLESNIGFAANNYIQLSATPGTPDGTKYLRDDGTWQLPAGTDAFTVKTDAAATAGYLGVDHTDGVLRADGTVVTITDGGDYVTLGVHAYLSDIAGLTLVEGDVLYVNATGDITNLGPGTSGQFLETQGASNPPRWGDPVGSGDITAVGDAPSGAAFTEDGSGNSLYFEGTTANTFEVRLTAANPDADYVVTIPARTGTLLQADGDGSALTGVDAATGDSATAFFDAGTIEYARGGLEADVSAFDGLVKISGSSTSAVTVTAAGEAILDDADAATQRATLGLVIGTNVLAQQTIGIADNNLVETDDASISATDYARFTANGIEGRTAAEARTDLNVEQVDADILRADTADTIQATIGWGDDKVLFFGGTDSAYDASIIYDATTDDRLELLMVNAAADEEFYMYNSDATYKLNLRVGGTVYAENFETTGFGDSYAELSNNASLAPSGYRIYVENSEFKISENGQEEILLTQEDGATLTGTSWDFSGVTNLVLPTAVADASGEISISTGNQLVWHDGAKVVRIDTTTTTDNYVLKYDNATATFNLEEDATGGTPTWDSVGDPTADVTIDHDAGEETAFTYTGAFSAGSQFLIEQLTGNPTGGVLFEVKAADTDVVAARLGDSTNYAQFAKDGSLTFAGTASFSNANDSIDSEHYVDNSIDAQHISDFYAYELLPVSWFADGTTAPGTLDDASTRSPWRYRDFAGATADEDVDGVWQIPDDADVTGGVWFRVHYVITNATGPSAEGVAFALQGASIGAGDATNPTPGTAVVVTDTSLTESQWDYRVTGWSSAVTLTDAAAGEMAELNFYRDQDHASDTYAQDVGIAFVEIRYTRNPE